MCKAKRYVDIRDVSRRNWLFLLPRIDHTIVAYDCISVLNTVLLNVAAKHLLHSLSVIVSIAQTTQGFLFFLFSLHDVLIFSNVKMLK